MRFILKLIEFGGVGLGIFLIRDNGFIHHEYITYYNSVSPSLREQLPAQYLGILQILAFTIWVFFATAVWFILSRTQRFFGILEGFQTYFADEANIFYKKYFNDRLHEVHKNEFEKFLTNPQTHDEIIKTALYKLRHALIKGYKHADLRLTLMVPQIINSDSDPKLYIEYWANEEQRTPMTKSANIGFGPLEGFAGRAWETHKVQIGGKRKLLILPDTRYKDTSVDQESVKSFCSIPIFDESPGSDRVNIVAILNIDSDRFFYFPLTKGRARQFIRRIRPITVLIAFHLIYREALDSGAEPNAEDDPQGALALDARSND